MVGTGRNHLLHKGGETEEKGRVEERRVKEIATLKAARAWPASSGSRVQAVVARKAQVVVAGWGSRWEGGGGGEAGSQHSELESANIGK